MWAGHVQVRSVVSYLAAWVSVLWVAQVVVLGVGYALLYGLGVVHSASRSLALVFGQALPESGLLPALAPTAVLSWIALVALIVSLVAFVSGLAMVIAHNVACDITGGPLVQLREDSRRRSPSEPDGSWESVREVTGTSDSGTSSARTG